MKEVFCPNGHKLGEIDHKGNQPFFSTGATAVRVESTMRGFLVYCPVCGASLREWRVSLVGLVEKVVQDVVADLLYQLKMDLLAELRGDMVSDDVVPS